MARFLEITLKSCIRLMLAFYTGDPLEIGGEVLPLYPHSVDFREVVEA